MLPTYQEQFDKITEAYIKDEIKPFSATFCFCGTLAGTPEWCMLDEGDEEPGDEVPFTYRANEYTRMEYALFEKLQPLGFRIIGKSINGAAHCLTSGYMDINEHPDYEDALLDGMCNALEVLKEIHREHGEVIDDAPVFQQRILQPSF